MLTFDLGNGIILKAKLKVVHIAIPNISTMITDGANFTIAIKPELL